MTGNIHGLKTVCVIFMAVFSIILSAATCLALNDKMEKEPPADSVKLWQESEKKFHVSKHGQMIELREGLSKPYPGKPEDAAAAFLKDYHDMFELSKDVSELKLEKAEQSMGDYKVQFRRHYKGIQLFRGGAALFLDNRNRVKWATVSVIDENTLAGLKTSPAIKSDMLQDFMGKAYPELGPIYGAPKLVVYKRDGDYILAYLLIVAVNEKQRRFWDMIVDADTGEILVKKKGWLED